MIHDPHRVLPTEADSGVGEVEPGCAMLLPVTRSGRMLAVGGVPAYRGFALPQGNRPPGMLVPVRENAERAVADANVKVARIVQTEDAFFEAHPDGALFRYPLIYGPGQINPREIGRAHV